MLRMNDPDVLRSQSHQTPVTWRTTTAGVVLALAAVCEISAFRPPQSASGIEAHVEVATIHRNKDAETVRASIPLNAPVGPVRMQMLPGGTLRATGISLGEMVREAYGYTQRPAGDVSGGPGWLDSERYDVIVKADRSAFGPVQPWGLLPQDAAEMMRQFLADRFKLQTKTEQRERTIFNMVLARSDGRLGPGLTPSDGSCLGIYAPPGPGLRCPFTLGGGLGFQTGNITMPELANILAVFPAVGTRIVDRTGLGGGFDVKMTRFIGGAVGAADPNATDDRPSMTTALQEMLGLKLERTRGPVDVLIVERAERPTEN